jgi:ribosomal protein S18 acetylase RimI-like enzyme
MALSETVAVREATTDDAELLARLIDLAGEGMPAWVWSRMAEPGQAPLEIGAARARRETGGFSYRSALVAERDRRPVGMVLGYVVEPPSDADRAGLPSLPPPIRPLIELEHASAGSFYVNALAVLPGERSRGTGRRLLDAAEERARALGARAMSIQVFSANQGAFRLYTRDGYRTADSRPMLHPVRPRDGEEVLLLVKDLAWPSVPA